MRRLTEFAVEGVALNWLGDLGYDVLYGPDISADGDTLTPTLSQRETGYYSQVVLENRSRNAFARLNSKLSPEALEDSFRKLIQTDAASLPDRAPARHYAEET